MPLTPEDLDRHRRHILIKEIGGPGVQRLKAASVSLVGAGALGGPCALYLAAAGCGRIEILDDDTVERSNLQRQIQFSEAEIGLPKAEQLASRLHALDPSLDILPRRERFGPDTELAGKLLIDASDNYETRFALNALAHASGRRLVSGAAIGWQGQVAVFASRERAGSPCYRCYVPGVPPEAEDCETIGVMGAVTGIVGAQMALQAIKCLTGAGDDPAGQLWLLDGLSAASRLVHIGHDPSCQVCGA